MRHHDQITIARPPEIVWDFVADPARVQQWNPKLTRVTPLSWGERGVGTRFRASYTMSGKSRDFTVEIIAYDKPRALTVQLRLDSSAVPWNCVMEERYELVARNGHTELHQRVQAINTGIPWYWRLVIALVSRFGTPVGTPYLQQLKQLVEQTAPA